jgi:hypothetical protein
MSNTQTKEEYKQHVETCQCCRSNRLFQYIAMELAERNGNRLKIQIMRPEESEVDYAIRMTKKNDLVYIELRLLTIDGMTVGTTDEVQ